MQLRAMGSYNWEKQHEGNFYFCILNLFFEGTHLLWTRARNMCFKTNFARWFLFGCLWWALCWHHRWFSSTENHGSSTENDGLSTENDGRCHLAFVSIILQVHTSGFHTLAGASYGPFGLQISPEERISLNQLFPVLTEGKEDGIGYKSFREQYKSYKESYVKYMRFDPEKANLSIKDS